MRSKAHVWFFRGLWYKTCSISSDLPEAEAELVSGYNVEYSAFTFALFFLAFPKIVFLFKTHLLLVEMLLNALGLSVQLITFF